MASGDALTVRDTMVVPNGRAIAFVGFDDRTVVEHLRSAELFVEAGARRPLDTDEFWPDELVGLTVRDRSGNTLGVVESVDDTSAQTRLTVLTDSGQFQVPLVRDLIPDIYVSSGYLVVADLPGLLSED